MAADKEPPITFVVPGTASAPGQTGAPSRGATVAGPAAGGLGGLPGSVKSSVQLGTQRGAAAPPVRVTAVPGEDVVAIQIDGGPLLLLNPATARDLMLAQGSASAARGAATADDADVQVTGRLRWPGLDQAPAARGVISDVLISAFHVLTGTGTDPAVDFATSLVVQHVDGQVDAGVYPLKPGALTALKGSGTKLAAVPAATGPLLVLIHGTFVDTVSTFGKLWELHAPRVAELFTAYSSRVYALDHPTLGASPIANAMTLVQALPAGARLHLVTHSRGGLVAEVLARVAGQRGIGEQDLAFFADAAYERQRAELQALAAAVAAKDIRVERVVRVACPARGTLLASKRLDAYLSVLRWTLELSGVPVAPQLVEFLAEVARRRADPSEIPGLASMIPDTPIVNWLNAAPQPIAGDLRVVAGDLQGDTVVSWLKTLLADAYYWTDNDIVVQTRSMYGGSPRSGGATFLLDAGGKTTHFDYFKNDRTANAVVDALLQAQPPAGFGPIGPLSWAGQDAGGARGAVAADPTKPAVFVLPGIVGSNLAAGGERIWLSLHLIGGLKRLAYVAGDDSVQPDGPVQSSYGDLITYLGQTHDVIPFAYDWRRPMEQEAARLADRIEEALDARKASGQPVRLLAHSMGGLVARTMQLERPATWQRLMSVPGARLLMLGTPNGGSWSPMQVLSGDDTFGNLLASFGSPFANQAARQLMAEMPGFLQLQGDLLDPDLKLADAATWQQLADDDYKLAQQHNWWHSYAGELQEPTYRWGVPTQAVLDQAKALRVRLDAQMVQLATQTDRMLLVVGHAKFTPDGYEIGNDGFVYRNAVDGGDGRVPLEKALLPGVKTWTLDCEHGSLPTAKTAFDAYGELLATGTTTRLALFGASRGAAAAVAHVTSRPSRARPSPRPAQGQSAVFTGADGQSAGDDTAPQAPPLRVTVLNGNLTFVSQPLMIGHYRALELTGTEAVVDKHLGGAMAIALETGLYPDAPGTHRIFYNQKRDPGNPWQLPRPQAAVVIGLGDEGALTASELELSVCQGAKAWAQRAAEDGLRHPDGIELAATLIGSGGIGISTGGAARALAQGVRRANLRLAGSGWPMVTGLTLVELYLDRASDAWRGLQVLATAAPKAYAISPVIASGTGPLRRQPESGYRGAGYDLISMTTAADGTISFALDTRRARTEVRAQHTQPRLMRLLVERAATARVSDPQLGRTLFQLLVPLELEPFLGGTDRVVLQLDEGTAPIPWELLDTRPSVRGGAVGTDTDSDGDGENDEPWAIRTRLLRKLRTTEFRNAPRDANADAAVLVIGEPKIDDPAYPRLPGAAEEARAVAAELVGPGGLAADRVTALTDQPTFDAIIGALMAGPWRIVHVAGHGEPSQPATDQQAATMGGVVLSEGVYLGPDEIAKLPVVPELVFVNCCHLGGHDAAGTLRLAQPVGFAAGVADSLIGIGVRCVIAAGWAVDDEPAKVFATRFYRELLDGQPFIDAVAEARRAARQAAPDSKTWAAYQCYGDPNWVFRRGTDDAQGSAPAVGGGTEHIASALGLVLALEDLAVHFRYDASSGAQREVACAAARARLVDLETAYAPQWGGMGAVAEAYGVAWDALGNRDAAIDWYQRALQANDASASLKAHEQLGNLRVRRAWAQVADKSDTASLDAARAEITDALRELQTLAALQPTIERLSLWGSGWKRLAQLEDRAGLAQEHNAALSMAAKAYADAEARAAATNDPQRFYPGLNRMAIELVLHAGDAGWAGFDTDGSAALRASLQAKHASDPDFWSNAGLIEFDLYQALARGALASTQAALAAGYAELHERVQVTNLWGSVVDQAGFVLAPLADNGSAADRQAAAALQSQLARYVS